MLMSLNYRSSRFVVARHIVISLLLTGCLMVLVAGCAPVSKRPTLVLREHPLVGKIWDVKQQVFIEKSVLLKHLLKAEFLLLGERHDNLVHHQHQSWVIQQLQQSQRQASVAFEMIDDQQGLRLAQRPVTSVAQLIAVLNHSKNHWDYEIQYKDLFARVMAAGYMIIPANLNRQRLRQTVKQGEARLPKAYQQMLQHAPLSARQLSDLRAEINESHCNMLDDKTAKMMILGQRVRDAVIAHSLVKSRTPMKVLIAGAGHVRNDRGVPLYLAAQSKPARIVTLGFAEVEAAANDIAPYNERWGTKRLPFDFVWFTPQVKRGDMCASIRRHMKQK